MKRLAVYIYIIYNYIYLFITITFFKYAVYIAVCETLIHLDICYLTI